MTGLSGVYIGPSDLSLSLGHTPKLDQDEPEVVAAIARIREAAKARGLFAGIQASLWSQQLSAAQQLEEMRRRQALQARNEPGTTGQYL